LGGNILTVEQGVRYDFLKSLEICIYRRTSGDRVTAVKQICNGENVADMFTLISLLSLCF